MDPTDSVVLVTTGGQGTLKAVLAIIDTDFITGETIRVDVGRHLR